MPARSKAAQKEAPKKEVIEHDRPKKPEFTVIIGNLTEDPELRFTASGLAVANLRIAVQDRVFNEETEKWEDDDPQFFSLTAWRTQGENSVESLHKGDRIVAAGNWKAREYDDQNGDTHKVWEFTVRELGPSLLFRTVDINQPAARNRPSKPKANQAQRVADVDPWETSEYSDEPPF